MTLRVVGTSEVQQRGNARSDYPLPATRTVDLGRLLSHFQRRFKLLLTVPGFYLRSAFREGVHPFRAAASMYAAICERYTPEEAYGLGLLRPGANASESPQFMSKSRFVQIQKEFNPSVLAPLLCDKGIFSRFCEQASLPVPEIFALFFKGTPGWRKSGGIALIRDEWIHLIADELPGEFVIKPTLGSYGKGVRVLQREGTLLHEMGRGVLSAAQLYEEVFSDKDYDSFIFEERLFNHADFQELSEARGLQTVRVLTIVDPDGTAHLLKAMFKVIVGNNYVDNFRSGSKGNLLAVVDLQNGVLEACWTCDPNGRLIRIEKHPETGVEIAGFQLPQWQKVVQLALDAALKFLPIRAVGWDIGMTPGGPVLVEGNMWSDPPPLCGRMDDLVARMRRGSEKTELSQHTTEHQETFHGRQLFRHIRRQGRPTQ